MSPEMEKFIMETVTKILKFIKWYFLIILGFAIFCFLISIIVVPIIYYLS